MTDPVAKFIRSDRKALLQAAPPPHAARVWHEARRRRAASLRQSTRLIGWLVRVLVSAALFATALWRRPELHFLVLLWTLSIWLTWAACAPAHQSRKGISQ